MERTLIELFELGGWAMWPLVAFSIATISLILERGVVLLTHNLEVSKLRSETVAAIGEKDIDGAARLCLEAPKRTVAAPVF
ncbi:MAG: MotA/TolQ/ExbB proton channel family protein, partial [Spirochaetota bacterium]